MGDVLLTTLIANHLLPTFLGLAGNLQSHNEWEFYGYLKSFETLVGSGRQTG
jgi:hypothetical protein